MEALSITLATQMLAQMNSVLIFAVWFLPFQLHSVIDESRSESKLLMVKCGTECSCWPSGDWQLVTWV